MAFFESVKNNSKRLLDFSFSFLNDFIVVSNSFLILTTSLNMLCKVCGSNSIKVLSPLILFQPSLEKLVSSSP